MRIVVDTNILISALLRDGLTRKLITDSSFKLLLPVYALKEIKNNESSILKKSKLSRFEFAFLIRTLLKYFEIIPVNFPRGTITSSKKIMDHIDKKDSLFIAAALFYNCPIWSDDKHFQMQNEIKIFTTKEIIGFVE